MTEEERAKTVAATEAWFRRHGLPYFVTANERRVSAALRRQRVLPALIVAIALAAAVGVFAGVEWGDVSNAIALAAVVLGLGCLVYALAYLHFREIMSWAMSQTFGSLSWLFPLITRALPLLLLFMTFLFINTEVWQVTSALDRGTLWLTVMMFAGVAVAFLLVRLPEEVRDVSEQARGDQLVAICAGTPVESLAAEVASDAGVGGGATEVDVVEMSRLRKINLVLVLLFAQALQVLLLSLSVFAFFILFGLVAIKKSVIQAWLGTHYPDGTAIPSKLPSLDKLPISNELFQVAVFLAAFSGLYFTVYAVTDENYRRQFFSDIAQELETAVGVQRVYLRLTAGGR
jgi:Ca2+/Na+ antiporter